MPKTACAEAGCGAFAVYRGRCREHSRQRNRETHRTGRLASGGRIYDSKRWQITRRAQLDLEPLCECGTIATDVDHIVPLEEGGDPWPLENLASLCGSCHSRKTRREQQGYAQRPEGNPTKAEAPSR